MDRILITHNCALSNFNNKPFVLYLLISAPLITLCLIQLHTLNKMALEECPGSVQYSFSAEANRTAFLFFVHSWGNCGQRDSVTWHSQKIPKIGFKLRPLRPHPVSLEWEPYVNWNTRGKVLKGAQCYQWSGSQNKMPFSVHQGGKDFTVWYKQESSWWEGALMNSCYQPG